MYVQGSYFGELENLDKRYRDIGRDGTAIVDSECRLLVISYKDLRSILKNFKKIALYMKKKAKERGQHHREMIEAAKVKANGKFLA